MQAPPVPDRIDELLTPEWLNAALGLRFPGIEVVSITWGPLVERVGPGDGGVLLDQDHRLAEVRLRNLGQ